MTPTNAVIISVCVLSIAANIFILAVICCTHRLRRITRHVLQASMALADVLLGCLHLAHYSRHLETSPGQECYQSMRLEVIVECLSYFVVGWTMVTLSMLITLRTNYQQAVARFLNSSIWVFPCGRCLSIWTWLVGACVVVPVVLTSASYDELPHVEEVMCLMYLPEPIIITFSCLALHLPCYTSLAQLVTIIACQFRSIHRTNPETLTEGRIPADAFPGEKNCVFLNIVPVVTYSICHLPMVIVTLVWFINGWTPNWSISVAVTAFMLSRSLLQPFTWLTSNDLRDEILKLFRSLTTLLYIYPKQGETSTMTSVEYNALVESQVLSEI